MKAPQSSILIDLKDTGLGSTQPNSSKDPILKNTQRKTGLVKWLKW
jgi:hypothetical protein